MTAKARTIGVDSETADLLEARAKARGVSVATLLADIAGNETILPPELATMRARNEGAWSAEALADDAKRLADFERTRVGVPWDEVKVWMESWGTPHERAAPKPRKL